MKAALVRIGNSRGIRIPKALIDQCGFDKTVEIRVEEDRLILSADQRPREGWDAAFRASGSAAQDELLLDPITNEFDREEWKW